MIVFCCIFLSTLPARGATSIDLYCGILAHYFYPRSPRGERRRNQRITRKSLCISIHAPREGSDVESVSGQHFVNVFLSTLPARGATDPSLHRNSLALISIHAPREGSDPVCHIRREDQKYFYPRSPRGERRNSTSKRNPASTFLSTLPARGATTSEQDSRRSHSISIHAPREGSDLYWRLFRGYRMISIHAPREGSDRREIIPNTHHNTFLSTLPARGATTRKE